MGKLFGTDGIRGIAGTDISCDLAMKIGRAVAYALTRRQKKSPNILIGRDTRISGQMIESALIAGICSSGANCCLAGVIPTPAVSLLVQKHGCDAGIMISASHNPMEFNGIKIFNDVGLKLSDELEFEIEQYILDSKNQIPIKVGKEIGRASLYKDAVSDYVD